ncbi:MAG: S-layer homology domain-containing protein [Candidatus Ancillula trichonymphae]|nr:S-layer homology domain-containing protein [Candidatus Ancillula trichonymphae]
MFKRVAVSTLDDVTATREPFSGSAVSDSYDVFASCVDNVIYMPICPAMKNAVSNAAASNANTTNAKATLAHMWFNWYAAEVANVSSLSTANSTAQAYASGYVSRMLLTNIVKIERTFVSNFNATTISGATDAAKATLANAIFHATADVGAAIKAGFADFARRLDVFKKGFTVFVPTTVPTPTVDFASVVFDPGEDMQFRPQIETLVARDITTGAESADGKVHFYGNSKLTRGQLAMFLYRAYGSPDVYINELEDSSPDSRDHQFKVAIAWLKKEGIAGGVDNKFYPDATIRRSEVAKLIAKTLNLGALDTTGSRVNFSDIENNAQVSEEIAKYILTPEES